MTNKAVTSKTDKPSHYERLAEIFRIAKYAALICMVIYLLLSVAVYRNELTVENFRYLMKYFDSSSAEYTDGMLKNYNDIYLDATSDIMLGLFNNDLAVVKNDSINIYNMLGNNTFSHTITYETPMLLTSDKYMLTYALGEYSYVINNSFSQLYGETYSYPITGADMSDSGRYLIVTRTLEYKGAVIVYDSSFNPIARILKDKYIMDAVMTENGSEVLVVSVYNQNGEFMSEIMAMKPDTGEEIFAVKLEDCLAVQCAYNDSGFAVLCEDRLLFCDRRGKLLEQVSFGGNLPTCCLLTDTYQTVVFNENAVGSRSLVTVYSGSGTPVYRCALDGRIVDMESDEGSVYILFENAAARLDIGRQAVDSAELENGCLGMVQRDADVLLICYTNRVHAYAISALFGNGEE